MPRRIQHCLSVFTDENLIESYLQAHPQTGEINHNQINSAEEFATILGNLAESGFARHVAFDPLGRAFVFPIADAIEILERQNE